MDTRCLAQAGTIKRCSTIAPACLPPRKGTTSDNDVTDNGLCGIAGWNHSGTRILLNRVERNVARSEAGREARLLRRKLRKSRDGMSFL